MRYSSYGSACAAIFVSFMSICGRAEIPAAPSDQEISGLILRLEQSIDSVPNNKQNLFVLGMLYAKRGLSTEAAANFRKLLVIDPDLVRPRLELARVLFKSGDYEGARYHFEQVLVGDLPDGVRLNVRRYLSKIREESPSYSFLVELVSDSNPKQATEEDEIFIDGIGFRLNEDAKAESATGVRFVFDARLPVPDDPLWFGHLLVDHNEYPDSTFDFSILQGSVGHHFQLDGHTLKAEVGRQMSRYQGERLYEGWIGSLSDFRQLKSNLFLDIGVSAFELSYPDYSYRDGWQYVLQAKSIFLPSMRSRIEAALSYTIQTSEEDAYSFRQPQVSARYSREWAGGYTTGISASLSWTEYDGLDPLFLLDRNDREKRIEFDVLNRRWSIGKVAPRLHVGWTQHDSEIDFYRWDRGFVRLGFTGEF